MLKIKKYYVEFIGDCKGFVVLSLEGVCIIKWCRLPESNWRPTDYKSVALPTELSRLHQISKWCPEAESNHRHEDFQSSALPTELSGQRRVLNCFLLFKSTCFCRKIVFSTLVGHKKNVMCIFCTKNKSGLCFCIQASNDYEKI